MNMGVGRRDFVKGLIGLGSVCFFPYATKVFVSKSFASAWAESQSEQTKVVHTLCLGCNTRCGIRVHVDSTGQRVLNVEGNPYHPNNTAWKPIEYGTSIRESLKYSGRVCLKGINAAIDHVYDPFRVRVPLKRAGPRGSMKWKPIPWDQLITEVVEGGNIFSDIGEQQSVEGFRAVRDLKESANAAAPELGPKSNQVVILRGRGQPGRNEFLGGRWLAGAIGSINFIPHDAVCANGVQTAHKLISTTQDAYVDQMRVDLRNAKFILAFGDPYSSGQPAIVPTGAILSDRIIDGDLYLAVVNPRAGNVVINANKWIPIEPGTDGALLMGMIRWIIENEKYNAQFLENTTQSSAEKDGESTWTDATYLVIVDDEHPNHFNYLRAEDLGLDDTKKGKQVVMTKTEGGLTPAIFDEVDHAELFYSGEVDDTGTGKKVMVKSSLQLLREKAFEKSLDEWAQTCGVSRSDIEWLASELTAHGRQAGILVYRVFGSQPNGVYSVMAMIALHMLTGCINWKGGYLGAASFSWTKGDYDLVDFPGKVKTSGAKISREGFYYEKTSEYKTKVEKGENPYPATKPWFPKSYGGLWTEAFESFDSRYPYDLKILITYFGNPIFVLPAGYKYIETLKDSERTPLHIAIDTTVSETSMYADYIVPDVTGLEGSYGLMSPYPPCLARWTGARAPAIEPLTEKTNDNRPICAETFAIDVAKRLELPGFGENAIPGPDGKLYSLNRAEDYFLRAVANVAESAGVSDASNEELKFVEDNYPRSFVDYAKTILSEDEWKKVGYVIGRGGVFEPAENGFTLKGQHKYGPKRWFKFWLEVLAHTKHSITGKSFWGTAQYIPAQDMNGNVIGDLDKNYRYTCISYKSALHTQSRTIGYRYAREIIPRNHVEISAEDAAREGVESGNLVRISSKSFPEGVEAEVRVTNRLRPGTVAIMFHYGHWAHGGSDIDMTIESRKGDPKRKAGTWSNALARIDDLTRAPVVDPISGASTTGGFRVNLTKL